MKYFLKLTDEKGKEIMNLVVTDVKAEGRDAGSDDESAPLYIGADYFDDSTNIKEAILYQ